MTNQNGNEKKTLRFTKELLERDRDKTEEICEINVSTGTAWVVQNSDAPVLTADVIEDVGSPIQTAEFHFDGHIWAVDYFHGVPNLLEIQRQAIITRYILKDEKLSKEFKTTQDLDLCRDLPYEDQVPLNDEVKRLMLSGMIFDPAFSLNGLPEDAVYPIEKVSQFLLDALWDGYTQINNPVEDAIYQVKVLRNKPGRWNQRVLEIHEKHPLTDETDAENAVTRFMERSEAQRTYYITEMIADPIIRTGDDGDGVPLANLSERVLQCLDAAFQCVHDPAVRRRQLLSN